MHKKLEIKEDVYLIVCSNSLRSLIESKECLNGAAKESHPCNSKTSINCHLFCKRNIMQTKWIFITWIRKFQYVSHLKTIEINQREAIMKYKTRTLSKFAATHRKTEHLLGMIIMIVFVVVVKWRLHVFYIIAIVSFAASRFATKM